jgi:hypothetical protein
MTALTTIESENLRLSVLLLPHTTIQLSFIRLPFLPLFFNLHVLCPSCIAARQWLDRAAGYVYY